MEELILLIGRAAGAIFFRIAQYMNQYIVVGANTQKFFFLHWLLKRVKSYPFNEHKTLLAPRNDVSSSLPHAF